MNKNTIKNVEVKKRPTILVGEEADGFTIVIRRGGEEELSVRVDQEDPPGAGLAEIFEHLGYDVTVEEWY